VSRNGTLSDVEPSTDVLHLRADGVAVEVRPDRGGRVGRLRVDGRDLLVRQGRTPIDWGCYLMVPWAGRLRDGRLSWRGDTWQLPLTMPPHAIHGTLLDARWSVVDRGGRDDEATCTLAAVLDDPWPFGGRVEQRIFVTPEALRLEVRVEADDQAMPVIVGWHPWFVRRLSPVSGRPDAGAVELGFDAGAMLAADPPGIPAGPRVPVPPGPWDDTFIDVAGVPVVRWPGALELSLHAPEAVAWVVFTQRDEGICVEPQTGAPNGLNGGPLGDPPVVEPGQPVVASLELRWRALGNVRS
jgi:aldose 1-epimerase